MSDTFAPTTLSEIICTRLSHDLIGNIGAVSNAVELLNEDPECVDEIKPILDISAKTLTARLKFFRLAFGLDNSGTKTIYELEQLISAYLATIGSRNTPISLKLDIATPELYKIILPAVMAIGDTFIRGGELCITESPEGLLVTAISGAQLSAAKLNDMQTALNNRIPEENPAQSAPILYLKKLLETKGVSLQLKFNANQAGLKIG